MGVGRNYGSDFSSQTLWRHKWVALPVVVLTIAACVYVMFFAQRTYQANMTYALITPKVPTAIELENSPELAKINGDNPYLRSSDNTLLSQVLITKLGAEETVEDLQERGLGTEYTVAQASTFGSGMLFESLGLGHVPQTGGRYRRGTGYPAHSYPSRCADD